jgi:hypothetical protein
MMKVSVVFKRLLASGNDQHGRHHIPPSPPSPRTQISRWRPSVSENNRREKHLLFAHNSFALLKLLLICLYNSSFKDVLV